MKNNWKYTSIGAAAVITGAGVAGSLFKRYQQRRGKTPDADGIHRPRSMAPSIGLDPISIYLGELGAEGYLCPN